MAAAWLSVLQEGCWCVWGTRLQAGALEGGCSRYSGNSSSCCSGSWCQILLLHLCQRSLRWDVVLRGGPRGIDCRVGNTMSCLLCSGHWHQLPMAC